MLWILARVTLLRSPIAIILISTLAAPLIITPVFVYRIWRKVVHKRPILLPTRVLMGGATPIIRDCRNRQMVRRASAGKPSIWIHRDGEVVSFRVIWRVTTRLIIRLFLRVSAQEEKVGSHIAVLIALLADCFRLIQNRVFDRWRGFLQTSFTRKVSYYQDVIPDESGIVTDDTTADRHYKRRERYEASVNGSAIG